MKKLMIAAAIVCAAVFAQAASVTWQSGSFVDLPTCYGYTEYDTTGCGESTGCITAYVWESLTAFSYKSAEEVWDAYQKGTIGAPTATATSHVDTGKVNNLTGAGTYEDGATVYAAILYLHNQEDANGDFTGDQDFYMANLAQGEATEMGGSVLNLGNTFGGGTAGAATAWTETAAIPEPTSGLLLLLGMAGLALRRRRA